MWRRRRSLRLSGTCLACALSHLDGSCGHVGGVALSSFTSLDAFGEQVSQEMVKTSRHARIPLEVDIQEVSLDDVDGSVRFVSDDGGGG